MLLCLIGIVYLDIGPDYMVETLKFHDQVEKVLALLAGAMMGVATMVELGFCAITIKKLGSPRQYFEKGLTTLSAMMHLARPQLLVSSAYVNLLEDKIEAADEDVRAACQFIEYQQMKHFILLVNLAIGKVQLARGEKELALK